MRERSLSKDFTKGDMFDARHSQQYVEEAFGEGDTKGRIQNPANWRKPGFWVVLAAVVGCAALAVCLLTNPMNSGAQGNEDGYGLAAETFENGGDGETKAISGSGGDAWEVSPDAARYPDAPLEMLFFSGAGAWGTTLTLQPDGTFTGEHYEDAMWYNESEYPHGTIYICRFSGRFSEPTQISDYAFSLHLEELTTEEPAGMEWIEDDMRYITSDPVGMADGEEFILYAPGTPADELSGEFRDTWWPDAWRWRSGELNQLNCWGLCNVNTEEGFFEYFENAEGES